MKKTIFLLVAFFLFSCLLAGCGSPEAEKQYDLAPVSYTHLIRFPTRGSFWAQPLHTKGSNR